MVIDMLAERFEECQYGFVETDRTGSPRPPQGEACCAPLLQAALDEEQADELADLLKALADPVRLRLVSIVATAPAGEVCACDLPGIVDRSQPTVSHHLSLLVRAGIMEREQRGKWAWFRLRRDRLGDLAGVLAGSG
jgi:ArsR family transcriptional regulator